MQRGWVQAMVGRRIVGEERSVARCWQYEHGKRLDRVFLEVSGAGLHGRQDAGAGRCIGRLPG